jgi:hypothetical protein
MSGQFYFLVILPPGKETSQNSLQTVALSMLFGKLKISAMTNSSSATHKRIQIENGPQQLRKSKYICTTS